MFIVVNYKDAAELSLLRCSSSQVDLSVERTLLVNPDCYVRNMLEFIRKSCKLGPFTKFDLCDETGCLKGLFEMPTYAYATGLFENAKTYYIIVMRQESDRRLSVLPQLNWENRMYAELRTRVRQFLASGGSSSATGASPGKSTPPGSKGSKGKTTPPMGKKKK